MKEKERVLELLDAYFDSELDFKEQSLVTRKIIEGDPDVIQKIEALRLIKSELNIWCQQNNSTKTNFWEKIERDICKIAAQQNKRNSIEKFIENFIEEIKYVIFKPIPLGFAATAALFVFALTHSFHSYYYAQNTPQLALESNLKKPVENIMLVSGSEPYAENNSFNDQLIFKETSEEKKADDDLNAENLFKRPELKPLSIKLLSAADAFNNKPIINDFIADSNRNPTRFALIDNQRPLHLNLGNENHNQLQTQYKLVNFK